MKEQHRLPLSQSFFPLLDRWETRSLPLLNKGKKDVHIFPLGQNITTTKQLRLLFVSGRMVIVNFFLGPEFADRHLRGETKNKLDFGIRKSKQGALHFVLNRNIMCH